MSKSKKSPRRNRKPRKPKPLWQRATRERDAAAFLKKHKDEFPKKSFEPDPIEFGGPRTKFSQQQIAALIADYMPLANAKHQKIAKLFLAMPPREIAKKLGWDRDRVYLAIRTMKRYVQELHRAAKDALVNGRTREPAAVTDAALRRVKFHLHETEKSAYLVSSFGDLFWVDDDGLSFPAEIQDILFELDEHEAGFEVLDVQHG